MISVCLATCNGGPYIEEQLRSILEQLGESDEVIIGDDRSDDDTVARIERLADPRVRVIVNESRLGHVQNFAKILGMARGEVVFLSDQDDVWLPGRKDLMLNQLSAVPGALLVASNFDLMDGRGMPTGTFDRLRNTPVNPWLRIFLVFAGKMPYWGCTFAMKRELLNSALPIPKCIESHDIWIAIVGNMRGRVVNFEGSTLRHRVHKTNVTAPKRRALAIVLRSRFCLLYCVVARAIGMSLGKLSGS